MRGKAWCSVVVVAAVGFGATGCSGSGECGGAPSKPKTIRIPSFFGTVTSDPRRWTASQLGVTDARLVVGGRAVTVDARTERLGYCPVDATRCGAFVGLRGAGVADWVMLAYSSASPRFSGQRGRLLLTSVTTWKVRASTVVLSQGVELPFGRTLSQKFAASEPARFSLRYNFEHDSVGADLDLDAATGEVLAASFAGCA